MHILHVITDLDLGGAELMLKRLINSFREKPAYRHSVISLTGVGKVGEDLRASGIEVHALDMRSPLSMLSVLWRLVRLIRGFRPDIVQTWLYHADLLGGVAARIAGNRKVIWGLRGSAIPQSSLSSTQFVVNVCALLSRFVPSTIVCCAESARIAHSHIGYDKKKMRVIPNGYDLKRFSANPTFRQQAREAFGFSSDDLVIGMVGRFDALKDHRTFVLAATALLSKSRNVKLLMVGRGIDSYNVSLGSWLVESGHSSAFVLAGERDDIPQCLAAMDIFCLSSRKEGFPNVVCEAMAMQVPCVVTDAGDAAAIVADTGIVVPPADANALTGGLQAMIVKGPAERTRLGALARRRIEEHYSMETVSARFESVYRSITG